MPRFTPASPSPRDVTVPDTAAIRAALAYGVDVGALAAQLTCTPAERLRRLDALVSLQRRIIRLPGADAAAVVAARRGGRA